MDESQRGAAAEASHQPRRALTNIERTSLEARLLQAERQLLDAQELLSGRCRDLPVPFLVASGLPVDGMVQGAVDAFRRARRAKLRIDAAAVEERECAIAEAAANRSASPNESEPGGTGRPATAFGAAKDAELRAELRLLRKNASLERECSALVDRLRGIAAAKNTLTQQRIAAAEAEWRLTADGDDDRDHDESGQVTEAGSVMNFSSGGALRQQATVDHFLGARHAVQSRQARRRRGHNTLNHAVEQAKLGYAGMSLRARNALPLNITQGMIELEQVRLDESKRERDVLLQLLDARVAAKKARDDEASFAERNQPKRSVHERILGAGKHTSSSSRMLW
jgi:hypothetical protein